MNTIQFIFRNKQYKCNIWVDISPEPPFYIFIEFIDNELIKEFGDEITIKTNFETRLSRRDDYPDLVELRQAIFNAIQTNTEFITKKNKINTRLQYVSGLSNAKHIQHTPRYAEGDKLSTQ